MSRVRTHVMLPKELLDRLDQRVGKRRRSEFIADAIELKLRNERQLAAFRDIVDNEAWLDVPEWDDPDAWLEESRRDRDLDEINPDAPPA